MKVVLSDMFKAYKAKYKNMSDEEYYEDEGHNSISLRIIDKTDGQFVNGSREMVGLSSSTWTGKFFAILDDNSQVPMDFISPAEDFTTTW